MLYEAFKIIFLAALALLIYGIPLQGRTYSQSCGHVFNVSTNTYPYGSCSDPSYELVCENNKTVLYVNYGRHLAEATYASNSTTLQSITAGLDNNNCPSITHHSLPYSNFSYAFNERERLRPKEYNYYAGGLLFVSCQNPLYPDPYQGIEATCTSEASQTLHSYVLLTWYLSGVPESSNGAQIFVGCGKETKISAGLKMTPTWFFVISQMHQFLLCSCFQVSFIDTIVVAFSCIQMSPNDRPSMSRVAEMLQGDVDPSEILPPESSDIHSLMANSSMYRSSIRSPLVLGFIRFFKLAIA